MRHILVATDLSPVADAALERATAIAAREGARITVLHAELDYVATPAMGAVESAAILEWVATAKDRRAEEEQALAARLAKVQAAGVEVTSRVQGGNPDDVAAEVAAEIGADLIVIGTHGRTGLRRFVLGSVAEKIVRSSPINVLVHRGDTGGEYAKVLVGTDFSPAADEALRTAFELAAPGAQIEIAHAWHYPPGSWGLDTVAESTPALETLRDALTAGAVERGKALVEKWGDRGRTVHFHLLHGPAAHALTERAEQTGVDLIAVGTHGYRGLRRFLLGSAAEAIVRHAPCSVLAAHAPAA